MKDTKNSVLNVLKGNSALVTIGHKFVSAPKKITLTQSACRR